MPRLRGGSHGGLYYGESDANARDGASNLLEPAFINPDRTPSPRVQCHISEGQLPVPMPIPRLPGVVLYL